MDVASIFERRGGYRAVADLLGKNPNTVLYWERRNRIPAEHVLDVERVTGVSRHIINPKLYPVEAAQ